MGKRFRGTSWYTSAFVAEDTTIEVGGDREGLAHWIHIRDGKKTGCELTIHFDTSAEVARLREQLDQLFPKMSLVEGEKAEEAIKEAEARNAEAWRPTMVADPGD